MRLRFTFFTMLLFAAINTATALQPVHADKNYGKDDQSITKEGQLVKSWNKVNAYNSAYGLDVNSLPPGIHMLTIILPEENIVKRS